MAKGYKTIRIEVNESTGEKTRILTEYSYESFKERVIFFIALLAFGGGLWYFLLSSY